MIQIPYMLDDNAKLPTRGSAEAAAYDLYSAKREVLRNVPKLISTGFSMALPKGYVGMICSRSGLALNDSIIVLNSPGLIDSDYRGDIGVILQYTGDDWIQEIPAGTRIAQLMIMKHENINFSEDLELAPTARGTAGFGSTGKE
jgi:dUTP pyrophosphatase